MLKDCLVAKKRVSLVGHCGKSNFTFRLLLLQHVVNQMEFRAIKRRLDDGSYFWGVFGWKNDAVVPPSSTAAERVALLDSIDSSTDSDAGSPLADCSVTGTGEAFRWPADQLNSAGGHDLEAATASKQKD